MTETKRTCSRCKQEKPIEDFGLRNRKRNRVCKACCAESVRKVYATSLEYRRATKNHKRRHAIENHRFLYEYLKTHPCVDCGEADPLVLEFDHVTGTKADCISSMVLFKRERLLEELAKCVVRCANCHTKKTVAETRTIRYLLAMEDRQANQPDDVAA